MIFHHGICIAGMYTSVHYGTSANDLLAGSFACETSNAPMHFRLIIKTLGLRYSKMYEYAEYMYFALYIYFRGYMASPVVFGICTSATTLIVVRLVAFGLLMQSYHFMIQMSSIIKNRYNEYLERKRTGIDFFWFSHNPKIDTLNFASKGKKANFVP